MLNFRFVVYGHKEVSLKGKTGGSVPDLSKRLLSKGMRTLRGENINWDNSSPSLGKKIAALGKLSIKKTCQGASKRGGEKKTPTVSDMVRGRKGGIAD